MHSATSHYQIFVNTQTQANPHSGFCKFSLYHIFKMGYYKWCSDHNHAVKYDSIIVSVSSVETQKGAINIQRCSVDNQKGAKLLYNVYGGSALLVLNKTSLNNDSTLLALN